MNIDSNMSAGGEAGVEGGGDGGAVEVSADDHEFYHAVAVGLVPVAHQARLALH